MRRPSGTSTRWLADPAARRPGGDVGTAKRDAPAGGGLQAHQRLEQRGLAGAVGAQHGDNLAGLDVQRHAAHRVDAAVAHVEVVDLKTHERASGRLVAS